MLRLRLKFLTIRKNSSIHYWLNNQGNKKGGNYFRLFYCKYSNYAGIGGNDQGAR
jgi:hypothetical protein